MFNNILVICAGNICRSPIAEVMLKAGLPAKNVTSAGLVAKDGMAADPHSIALATEGGYDLSEHSARKLTTQICADNDLILVMEPQHLKDVAAKFPQASGKAMLLGKWTGVEVIPDPHRQSREAFEHAYKLMDEACQAWIKRLG